MPAKPRSTVLLVDDDQVITTILSDLFAEEGFDPIVATRGEEAFDVIRRRSPDLILLDCRLPDLDGEEFVRLYRAMPGPHAPLIVLSGAQNIDSVAARTGAVAAVRKPFDLDQLMDLMHRQFAA